MTTEQRGHIIGLIIANMRRIAKDRNQSFDGGDMFFALAFKTDEELSRIAKDAGL